jgi:hypothetical protein
MTMLAASGRQPPELYDDKAAAEHDAEILRLRNVRDVERSRWRPNYRTEPATYTVIELRLPIEQSEPAGIYAPGPDDLPMLRDSIPGP